MPELETKAAPPSSVPASLIGRMRGRPRRLRAVIALGLGLALLLAGALWVMRSMRSSTAEMGRAYAALWGCVAGEALEDGESAGQRLRAIEARLGTERGDWPGRCQAPLSSFHRSISGDPEHRALRQLLEVELGCSARCSTDALVATLPQIDRLAIAANVRPAAQAELPGPPRLSGRPLPAAAFPVLVTGSPVLRGVAPLGDGRTSLLYRAPGAGLVVCEVAPDSAEKVRCGAPKAFVLPQSARLVQGKAESIVYGVTTMGASPDKTVYGAFRAWTGAPVDDDLTTLVLSSDRPRLGGVSRTWLEAELGGTHVVLSRLESGVLKLDQGETSLFVMDDVEHGGPATADPLAIVGAQKAVVLFQSKAGVAGLVVAGSGPPVPLENATVP